MARPTLDFFYFFGSGYAYLAVMRIDSAAAHAQVDVRWRPFSVRTLMREQNTQLRNNPGKMAYIWRDVERRARWHGLPFVAPPIWPTDPDELANRVAMVAAQSDWLIPYSKASFRAWFLEGRPLGDPDDLRRLLIELGQDPDAVLARAQTSEIADAYAAQTDAARALGIFGSPAFVVDGEVFWGDDRLEEALAWALGEHPAQR